MISILVTLILGGLAGWLASILVNRNDQMGIFWNIVVGVIGAVLANLFLAPLFGIEADLSTFSLSSFLMAVLGASVLLFTVNLITRKRVR